MALFAIEYRYTGDPAARDELRPAHRAFFGELHAAGHVLLIGPYTGDVAGALIIAAAPTAQAALAMLDADPFQAAGLIGSRTIQPWTQVYGPFGDQA